MATQEFSVEEEIFNELNLKTQEEDYDEIVGELVSEEEAELEDLPPVTDEEGHVMTLRTFENVFGWKPTHVPNFHVATFTGYECSDIPAIYIPPKEQFEQFVFYSERGCRTNLVGPTGAGKTLMAEFYAAATGRPFLRIEHNIELDKATVFGQVHITEGDTDFQPGVLPKAMFEPTVVVLDELTRATGCANIIYQRVFDRNEMYLPEMKDAGLRAIKPHNHFVICATDNTKGDGEDTDLYPASNVQDAAFRNRFDALIEVPYASQKEEKALISQLLKRGVPQKDIDSLAQFSALCHAGFEDRTISTAFSPRQLINICRDLNDGLTMEQSIRLVYLNFCSKSEYSDIINTYRTAFGRTL